MTIRDQFLVTAPGLQLELQSAAPPVVLDVRWRMNQPDGVAEFRAGHIPGSRYVVLDDVFSRRGTPQDGRHPLPSAKLLATGLARLGVRSTDRVVALDDASSWAAARAWWVLRDAGFSDVRVLDGGWASWRAANLPIETGDAHNTAVPVEALRLGHMPKLTIAGAERVGRQGVLVDARAPERFRGDVEPIDPRAGHIPGAQNLPVSSVFDPDGRFLPEQSLRNIIPSPAGEEPIGVYCGSGVSAAPLVLAAALLGQQAALYPGSWSQWANTPGRPISVGDA